MDILTENLPSFRLGYWLVQTLAMMLTCLLIPKLKVSSPFWAFVAVVALALVNAHFWDAALFFHIPEAVSTQALILLLANGTLFWVLVKILPGIEVEGIVPAMVAPLVFTVTTLVVAEVAQEVDWGKVVAETIRVAGEARDYFQQQQVMDSSK